MKTIEGQPGDTIYDALCRAVDEAPALLKFNHWTFETREGETLGDARQRFKDENGFAVRTNEEMREDARLSLEKTEREQREAIASAGVATEAELREMKSPWPKSLEELNAFITSLVDRPHDYGTCVHAMSLSAVAAMNYAASKLGCTGFQASCADMDILRRTRDFKWGMVLDYEKLLYPQYCDDEHFPSWNVLLADSTVRERLSTLAKEKLAESSQPHPDVKAHWEMLASA